MQHAVGIHNVLCKEKEKQSLAFQFQHQHAFRHQIYQLGFTWLFSQ